MPEKTEKQALCPNCKSCEVIPLLGTLPGFTAYDSSNPAHLPVAQCAETEEAVAPDWRCRNCGHEWSEAGEDRPDV